LEDETVHFRANPSTIVVIMHKNYFQLEVANIAQDCSWILQVDIASKKLELPLQLLESTCASLHLNLGPPEEV
jgi:hypothetical protein